MTTKAAKNANSSNGKTDTSPTNGTPETVVSLHARLAQMRTELNQWVLEREVVIDGMLAALLAKEHFVQIGDPGCGKSYVINLACSAIDGINYFQVLLHEGTPIEEVLGPISLTDWKASDIYRRKIDGRLPWAHVANLEEVFNAPPALLHTTHRITNERKFDNPMPTDCPLWSVLGSSNSMPPKQASAFADRILFWFPVQGLQDADNKKTAMRNRLSGTAPALSVRFSLAEWEIMHQEVNQVVVTEDILESLLLIEEKINSQMNLQMGDRRRNAIVNGLRGYAYLLGDSIVNEDHLKIVPFCLWKQPDQLPALMSIVSSIGSPTATQALESLENAKLLVKSLGAYPSTEDEQITWQTKASGVAKQLNGMVSDLQVAISGQPESRIGKAKTIISSIEGMRQQILSEIRLHLTGL